MTRPGRGPTTDKDQSPTGRLEGSVTATVRLEAASLTTGLGPESWQWLAFVFAAAVTLAFALVDDLGGAVEWPFWPFPDWKGLKAVLKAALHLSLFVGLFYVFIVNRRFRAKARSWLEWVRWDSR